MLAAAGVFACSRRDPSDASRPHVLLISIDSLRADHVGAYGYSRATTPTIDSLARDGVRFARAVSTTSWTLPAHASLLTGRHDAEHGATVPRSSLESSLPTLAEALAEAGYRTVGLYSGPFLDPTFGLARGFETYLACMSDSAADGGERALARRHAASHRDVTNPILRASFARMIAERDARPSFFFVHMWDVHYDLVPPAPYDRMFDPDYAGNFAGEDFRHARGFKPGMPSADYAHVLSLYDGEIRFTDDTIGAMLDELRRAGMLADPLVVVTSDHGDEFLEHEGKGHRQTLFQEVLAIPLVFWAPGRLAPAVAEASASILDVAPSILSIIGAPAIANATGRTLFDEGGKPLDDERVAIAELRVSARRPILTAAYAYPHKVIVDARRRSSDYYDLSKDPGERSPAAAHEVAAGQRLLEKLNRFYARVAREVPKRPANEKRLTPAMEKELRALGYLD